MLELSSNVSDVFPKVLKLSSEMSECKPLGMGGPVQGEIPWIPRHGAGSGAGGSLHSSTSQLHLSRSDTKYTLNTS